METTPASCQGLTPTYKSADIATESLGSHYIMKSVFAAAGNDREFLTQYKILRKNRDSLKQVRCVHGGGLACALALSGVEPIYLIAARSAALANNQGYAHVLNACLPTNAHELLTNRLQLALKDGSEAKVRRRYTSRQALIKLLIDGCSSNSAFSIRHKFHVHGGLRSIGGSTTCVAPLFPTVDADAAMVLISDT